jgi:hypothetical protein
MCFLPLHGRRHERSKDDTAVCGFILVQFIQYPPLKESCEHLYWRRKRHFCSIKFPKADFTFIVLKPERIAGLISLSCHEGKYSERESVDPLKPELCYLTGVNRDRPNQQA